MVLLGNLGRQLHGIQVISDLKQFSSKTLPH